jgi:molybdate transport system substrate-binding protein
MRLLPRAVLAATVAFIWTEVGAAAELRVYAAGAVKQVVSELAPAFEQRSGRKLRFTFGTVGDLRDRLLRGETADVAVLSVEGIEALQRAGKSGAPRELGSIGVGVAVRNGAPAPAIGTPEALKASLLAARSIGYADPASGATAGAHFARVIEQLGIKEEVNAKAVLLPFGIDVVAAVAQSTIEIGISQASEIAANPDVTLVGELPDPLQLRTTYAAAALSTEEPAQAFVAFLASSDSAEVLRQAGFRPVR